MKKILLKGGKLYDFGKRIDEIGDLLIEGERIARVGGEIEVPEGALPVGDWKEAWVEDTLVLNCEGFFISPGFIDLHVHLREPGGEQKETIESGTRAAVRGGFTSVCAMPNTDPPTSDNATVDFVLDRAEQAALARVFPVGTLTRERFGRELAPYEGMLARGVTLFSDDGSDVADTGVLAQAFAALAKYRATMCIHAEVSSLSRDGVMHEGVVSERLGNPGIPAISESIAVARAILIAEYHETPVHICHVSAAGSVELIRFAKAKGVPVTAEVTPHHLLLTDDAIAEMGALAKVNPPLRSAEDREILVAALRDGTIDCIASDHAPHTREEKELSMQDAPFGIVGLESSAGLVWRHLVAENLLPTQRFFDAMVTKPALILGARQVSNESRILPPLTPSGEKFAGLIADGLGSLNEGAPADITIFDPDAEWKVEGEKFESRAKLTPFEGFECKGRAAYTIVGGEIKYPAGE